MNSGSAPVIAFGSSPLARGTLAIRSGHSQRFRLIPARAGNTGRVQVRVLCIAAHPRSRGEHNLSSHAHNYAAGSSPLARGTRPAQAPRGSSWRLIPARAGNTAVIMQGRGCAAAHPRSRGEHGLRFSFFYLFNGSSPLARGTHLLTWGFTPYISKIESL